MTVEKMIAGQRSPRNPLVVEVLRDYGYVDARGMGIRTKVIPLMREHNQTDPLFKATEDFVKTDLFRLKGHRDPKSDRLSTNKRSEMAQCDPIKTEIDPLIDLLNEVQGQLLSALQKEPKAGYNTLAELLNVSPATVKRHIQKLKNMGRLKRIGSKKSGYWEVIG
jgi:ATP-dependent DNA helicase RecG